ncbi:MAG: tRNA (N6-isopentenyl adenosine(37)-C2)-methylthiotransferase MiaB [Candidatus Pacebacteria bacterium]|nr:tRNA (N6-isopentenyl adenosine(37)-C2)-methylthiotransferase MiaB [Candidatus Paceibacterota bacterium]
MTKTFHIRTYGCQMNERDSEALACMLRECGYRQVMAEEEADILLFNTCSVREQAERKVFGKVGILKKLKRRRPDIIIGVIGCMAQNYGRKILDELPHVDLVVGTDRMHLLPEILQDVCTGQRGQVHTEPGTEVLGKLRGHEPGRVSAFISVMRGCNQFCTYCIVPYVRGREKSRPLPDIVREVEEVVAQGAREIFLLGQNVTAYGLAELRDQGEYRPDVSPFADLLLAVNEVEGVERIRFTSPHPRFMNQAFIESITTLPKVCESLHVPLQSGSDRILKAMRRGYTSEDFMACIQAIRERQPEFTFTTDVIVGFPGETPEDFEATRRVMDAAGFEMAYIFKYSPRSGTKAAEMADDVPRALKEERNQILLQDLERRSAAGNDVYIGRTVEVLAEGPSKRNVERWAGRTRTNKVCIFPPAKSIQVGDLVQVHIERATPNSLFGEVL